MSAKDPIDLQSTFDKPLRSQFGVGVPQIATAVAVILGSLGLKERFDAGTWTVVAVLCFAAAYLYRYQISSRLALTTWWVIGFLVVFGAAGFLYYCSQGTTQDFWTWEKYHKPLAAAYFSFLTSASVAWLVTSANKQNAVLGRYYPGIIERAITDQLYGLDFYKEAVRFDIEVSALDNDWATLITELSYKVTNRTDSSKIWSMDYAFNRKFGGKVLDAKFDNESIQIDDPNYLTELGIKVPRPVEAGHTSRIYFKVEERFRSRDSELYTSYHPATDLKVTVKNKFPDLRIYFTVLHFSTPKEEASPKSIYLSSGILPFQGVRMNWRKPE